MYTGEAQSGDGYRPMGTCPSWHSGSGSPEWTQMGGQGGLGLAEPLCRSGSSGADPDRGVGGPGAEVSGAGPF